MALVTQLAMLYVMVFMIATMFLGAACVAIGGVQVLVALRTRRTKPTHLRRKQGRWPQPGTEYPAASHPRTSQ
jgi:hypothetical protein